MNQSTTGQPRASAASRPQRTARTAAATGAAVALALLGSFYSVVASAVDRGERRVVAADQSDIDEDLRTPPMAVVSVRATPSR